MPRKQLYTRILTPTLGRLTRSLAAPRQSRPRVGVKILVCRSFLPINYSALPRSLLAITYGSFITPMVYILGLVSSISVSLSQTDCDNKLDMDMIQLLT